MSSNHELDDCGGVYCLCAHVLLAHGGRGGGIFFGGRQGILILDRISFILQLLLLAKMALLTDCSSGISIISFDGD